MCSHDVGLEPLSDVLARLLEGLMASPDAYPTSYRSIELPASGAQTFAGIAAASHSPVSGEDELGKASAVGVGVGGCARLLPAVIRAGRIREVQWEAGDAHSRGGR